MFKMEWDRKFPGWLIFTGIILVTFMMALLMKEYFIGMMKISLQEMKYYPLPIINYMTSVYGDIYEKIMAGDQASYFWGAALSKNLNPFFTLFLIMLGVNDFAVPRIRKTLSLALNYRSRRELFCTRIAYTMIAAVLMLLVVYMVTALLVQVTGVRVNMGRMALAFIQILLSGVLTYFLVQFVSFYLQSRSATVWLTVGAFILYPVLLLLVPMPVMEFSNGKDIFLDGHFRPLGYIITVGVSVGLYFYNRSIFLKQDL